MVQQPVLVLTQGSYRIGLKVDKVIDRQEMFVRDLHHSLMALPGVGGASILGNGDVVIMINVEEAMQRIDVKSEAM